MKNELLKQCVAVFSNARQGVIEAIQLLYQVHESEAYKAEFETFSEFCEEALDISRSTGSQYIAVYKHYVVEGGLTVKQLRQTDTAKLYTAISLPGTPQKHFAAATTLSRDELKAEKRDVAPCTEHQWIEICAKCHVKNQD